jgi:hypothetical protein
MEGLRKSETMGGQRAVHDVGSLVKRVDREGKSEREREGRVERERQRERQRDRERERQRETERGGGWLT